LQKPSLRAWTTTESATANRGELRGRYDVIDQPTYVNIAGGAPEKKSKSSLGSYFKALHHEDTEFSTDCDSPGVQAPSFEHADAHFYPNKHAEPRLYSKPRSETAFLPPRPQSAKPVLHLEALP
jgi:hypothetical protein